MSRVLKDRLRYLGGESRWIPWAFVGFFVVVIAVNCVMMAFAFSTWPGLSTRNHYLEGLAYNDRLEDRRRQEALGWQVDLRADTRDGRKLGLAVSVTDAQGEPLRADAAQVHFRRPAKEGSDFSSDLRADAPGHYIVDVEMPLPGIWEVRVEFLRGGERHQTLRRVMARP